MPKQRFFNLPDEKREYIIDAAYDVFIDMDYKDVDIRTITKTANISIGSFYQYFYDKDDLYLYLMSSIEKKIYAEEEEKSTYFLTNNDITPIEEICTEKEIRFNKTWYNVPVEVMMKFYFGEYSKELNSVIFDRLKEFQNLGRIKDSVDIDFVFHIYATSMFNVLMYFREKNITDNEQILAIKKEFYNNWFLNGIIEKDSEALMV